MWICVIPVISPSIPAITVLSHLCDTEVFKRKMQYKYNAELPSIIFVVGVCVSQHPPARGCCGWCSVSLSFLIRHCKEVKCEGEGRKKREVMSRSLLLVAPRQRAREMHGRDMKMSRIRRKNWLVAAKANKDSLNEQHSYQCALTPATGDFWSLALCPQGKSGTMSSGDMEAGTGVEWPSGLGVRDTGVVSPCFEEAFMSPPCFGTISVLEHFWDSYVCIGFWLWPTYFRELRNKSHPICWAGKNKQSQV